MGSEVVIADRRLEGGGIDIGLDAVVPERVRAVGCELGVCRGCRASPSLDTRDGGR